MTQVESSSVDKPRLIKLKFKRNCYARTEALAAIRRRPDGKWQARIGGKIRGRTDVFSTRGRAEQAVNDHYNDVMMAWLKEKRWQ